MENYTDKDLEKLWVELTDVLFYEEDCYLFTEEDWHVFCKDTEREEIWHWFDERHSKGVAWLLYEFDWSEINA